MLTGCTHKVHNSLPSGPFGLSSARRSPWHLWRLGARHLFFFPLSLLRMESTLLHTVHLHVDFSAQHRFLPSTPSRIAFESDTAGGMVSISKDPAPLWLLHHRLPGLLALPFRLSARLFSTLPLLLVAPKPRRRNCKCSSSSFIGSPETTPTFFLGGPWWYHVRLHPNRSV